jgi:hypothetical protein
MFATVATPSAHRSLSEQDRYAAALAAAGAEARSKLQTLHARLAKLVPDGDERRAELRDAMDRLKPLVVDKPDSYDRLLELLGEWPDDRSDGLRAVVHGVAEMMAALSELDTHARANLEAGVDHPEAGEDARAHLALLAERLGSKEDVWALTGESVKEWNERARAIVKRLIKPVPPPPLPDRIIVPPPPPVGTIAVVQDQALSLADGDALGAFIGKLRRKLQDLGHGNVRIDVTVRIDDGGEA